MTVGCDKGYELRVSLQTRQIILLRTTRVINTDGRLNPRNGAHGKPVLFLHPKDFAGTLVELEQA